MKDYDQEGCARLASSIVEHAFRKAKSIDRTKRAQAYEFLHTKLFQMWCDVYEFDQEKIQQQMMKVIEHKEKLYKILYE